MDGPMHHTDAQEGCLRYGCLSVVVQYFGVALAWAAALVFGPTSEGLFELIIYFYWPVIYLMATLTDAHGEAGMIGLPLFGMLFGPIIYGAAVGLLAGFLKRRRLNAGEDVSD